MLDRHVVRCRQTVAISVGNGTNAGFLIIEFASIIQVGEDVPSLDLVIPVCLYEELISRPHSYKINLTHA